MVTAVDGRPRGQRTPSAVHESRHDDPAGVRGTDPVLRVVRFVRLLEVALVGRDAAHGDLADEYLPLSVLQIGALTLDAEDGSHGVETAEDLWSGQMLVRAAARDVPRQLDVPGYAVRSGVPKLRR